MATKEARKRATDNYMKDKHTIHLCVTKRKVEFYKELAQKQGKSLSALFIDSVEQVQFPQSMHINAVYVDGVWASFDIRPLNGEMAIVGTFVKDGKELGNSTYVFGHSFGDAMALADNEKATEKARKAMQDYHLLSDI